MWAGKLLLILLALATPSPASACRIRNGSHVVLYGSGVSPDVFVWDSRFRMDEYEGGTFDQAQALLPHALLAPAGTRATVQSCVARFIQSKYSASRDDAVGLVIDGGPLHGRRGWVLGSDLRIDTTLRPNRLSHR
jgi:hypothetical protein